MEKIKLIFERGGELIVSFNGLAPNTEQRIKEILPYENILMHSRYSGREVCFGIQTKEFVKQENSHTSVNKADVVYWCNWETPEENGLPGSPGAEVIGLYYGEEIVQFQGKPLCVNVFGYIDESQEALLEEIGNRIWQQGFEKVRAELIDTVSNQEY